MHMSLCSYWYGDILFMLTNKREFNSSALPLSANPGKEVINRARK